MLRSNINWNCKQVAKMVAGGTLKFDNAVQRGFVWDKKRQTLLIDSILRGYPIPPMYTIKCDPIENDKGKMINVFDCLDGKQRCTTIARFINDGFALGEMDYITYENGDEMDISGLLFSELDEELQDKINSYSLTVYFFSDTTEEEICEMMARLNNGKSLTSYELSRVKAKDLEGIQNLAQHPLFETISNKSYACEDIVVKSYAMLNVVDPCLDTKCIRPLIEEMVLEEDEINTLTQCFDYIKEVKDIILAKDDDPALNKKVVKKLLTKTHLVSMIPIAYRAIEDKTETEDFAEFLEEFFIGEPSKNDKYNEACKNGVGHALNVQIRNEALISEYERIFT